MLLSVVLLAGCATVGVSQGTEEPVGPSSLLGGYRAEGEAMVRVTRVSRFMGAACKVRLYANGQAVADLDSGRAVTFGVPAGQVALRAHFAERGACPSQVSTLVLQLDKGRSAAVVYDVNPHGQHVFQVLD